MIHLLTITLVILKALGFITWPWLLVLLPSFLGLIVVIGTYLVTLFMVSLLGLGVLLYNWYQDFKRR